jgi:hypothetical protein
MRLSKTSQASVETYCSGQLLFGSSSHRLRVKSACLGFVASGRGCSRCGEQARAAAERTNDRQPRDLLPLSFLYLWILQLERQNAL